MMSQYKRQVHEIQSLVKRAGKLDMDKGGGGFKNTQKILTPFMDSPNRDAKMLGVITYGY